nr:unnamed protein product [Callosobruchus chinensis]
MHTRNFFFSPQGSRSTRTKRHNRTFVLRVFRTWNELPGDVLVERASIGLFKSCVNKPPFF